MYLQKGRKLVYVLGRDVIGRPSRISYDPSTNHVIVTDDLARRLNVFSAADWTQQGFISPPTVGGVPPLQFPSGHCMTADGRLAVIDFETKSVVVWNTKWSSDKRRDDTESEAAVVYQTGLPCPGNVAVTSGGLLAVTDSKARPSFTHNALSLAYIMAQKDIQFQIVMLTKCLRTTHITLLLRESTMLSTKTVISTTTDVSHAARLPPGWCACVDFSSYRSSS